MNGSKVAIVTGGSRGIGRAVAERLASDGVAVAITYATSPESAHEIVQTVQHAGGRAVAIRANMADAEQIDALFSQAESESVASISSSPRPGS